MDRRSFLKAGAAGVAAAVVSYPGKTTHAQTKFDWKLVMSWGITDPVGSEYVIQMAKDMAVMTKGQLNIKVFGAGELVPALGVFDAVSQGSVEMFHSASYYWAGKIPATQFFCAVPFGMTPQQTNAWYYEGGGLDLWTEVYAPHNLTPLPAGNTGIQWGGWFRKEIKSAADFKGLKFRMPGLGGKVVASVGATVVLLPGPEIFPALERGVIDAAEWVGPAYDIGYGFHQAAKFYYHPGWHEPSTSNELVVNTAAWKKLPPEFQEMVRHAAFKLNMITLSAYDKRNVDVLGELRTKYKVQVRKYPDDLLKQLGEASEKIVNQLAEVDPQSRKVYDSYKKFQTGIREYYKYSEYGYKDMLVATGRLT
jgi:TRAP-type mannitol/chloroaromatic compound transport system substrate-binding protein